MTLKEKEEESGTSPEPSGQTPFERFEEFARKVVSVPKSEIEKRERAHKEQRKQEPLPD